MEVTCPSCGAVFGVDTSMGNDQVCPACMFPFRMEGPAAQGLPPAMLLDVQGEDGQYLGSMDRLQIRERIYSGVLKGGERIRETGGEWEPVGSRPEYAEVLHLIGVDVAGLAVARQQIKGWKRDASAGGTKRRPRPKVLPRAKGAEKALLSPAFLQAMPSRQRKMVVVLGVLVLIFLIDFLVSIF